MFHSLFNYSPTDGPVGCLQFGAVMSKTAMNIHVQVFVSVQIFISLGQATDNTIAEL